MKEFQIRATTTKQLPTSPEDALHVTFSEEDTTNVDTPHNDPRWWNLPLPTMKSPWFSSPWEARST